MSSPNPPYGNPADPPAEQPAWGPPPGGWGPPPPGAGQGQHREETRPVDPREWGQQAGGPAQYGDTQHGGQQYQDSHYGQPPHGQPPYGQQPHGQPPYGQQPYGAAPLGQPTQQWSGEQQQSWGPPAAEGWEPQPWAQQPAQPWGSQQGAQQWGPGYPVPPDSRPGTSRLLLILGGVGVLVVAMIAVLGFVTPGFLVTRVFDAAAVQDGVRRVLTDDYRIDGVASVTCGDAIQVTSGKSFDCQATIDGEQVPVPVRITTDSGNYEVGRPLT
ncbi:MAG: DUF4333 domain-containing protein [Pseudonocardia sp.]|nr:DUF4333 domain-containing protein [Pseudonocardia sp.]